MPPPKGAATQWFVCTLPTGCSPLQQPSGDVFVYLRVIHVPSLYGIDSKMRRKQKVKNKQITILLELGAILILINLMFHAFKEPRIVVDAVVGAKWTEVGCNVEW